MLAFYKLRFPIILLMIWILLPTGLSAVGLAQIRQGFAFSIFLFLAVFLSRPLLGALIAALIHTTFFVPLAFILCFVFFKDRRLMLLFAVIFVCIVGIFVGNNYFSMIAGQRVLEYGVDSAGATSINYIFGLILIMIPTVWSMMVKRTWPPILVVHFGVCIWLMMSFFLFPIGTNRLGYYSSLFAVPLVTNVWVFSREIKLYSIFILLPFLIYNVYLGVGIGRYAVLQLPF